MIRIASAIMATILGTGCGKDTSPGAQIVFDFTDERFAEFSAAATLEAVGSISEAADSPVVVGFLSDSELETFVFSTGQIFYRFAISIDPPHLHVSYDRITHNGEEVSLDEANRRIRKYAEAARLTHSRPAFRLSASSGAKNSTLARILDALHAEGIVDLLTEPSEPPVVANPPPRRVGTLHEIRPDDLFQTGAP